MIYKDNSFYKLLLKMDLSELELNLNDDLITELEEIRIDYRKKIWNIENVVEKRPEILTSTKRSPSTSPRTSQLSDNNPHFDNNTNLNKLKSYNHRRLDQCQVHECKEFPNNENSQTNLFFDQSSNNPVVANDNRKEYSLPTITRALSVNTTNTSSPALLSPQLSEKNLQETSVELLRVNIRYTGLSDIAGLEDVKQSLREAVIYPIKYPHLFKSGRQIWSRALLYGPPGVGKTALVQAVSAEANLPLYQVSSADLFSAWFGQTEKQIREMFSQLGLVQCILFIDEIDSLCRKRTSGDGEHSRRMQTELMVQMENYEGSSMFLICATNCPWDIDPAFLRRFQQLIYVPLPDNDAREALLLSSLSLGCLPTLWSGWSEVIDKTSGLTGADIKNIVRMASMVPLREMQKAIYWKITPDGKCIPCEKDVNNSFQCKLEEIPPAKVWCRQINIRDLWEAIKRSNKTVTDETLNPFKEFNKEHDILYMSMFIMTKVFILKS